jgi:taurine dioxygenase
MRLKYREIGSHTAIRLDDFMILNKPSPADIFELTNLLYRHKVLIIRGQELTDSRIEEFAFKFGSPFKPEANNPVLGSNEGESSIVIVGNNSPEFKHTYLGHQEVLPHSDHQWLRIPSSISMLYAIEIAPDSAPTTWTNMAFAYASLSDEMKARINDVRMITYNPFYRPFGKVSAKYVNSKEDTPPGETFSHPLVRTHPVTGESILYFNLAYEVEFVGMSYDEGSELFEFLRSHVLTCSSVYKHDWKNGDFVIWDNRSTIHYRPAFNSSVKRVLKRVTVAGEIPY